MKNFILLLALTVLSTQLQAQKTTRDPYLPVAVEGAQTLFYSNDWDYYPPWEDYYFGYHITGDTIIDGTAYKKVYYRNFSPVYYDPDEGLSYAPLYISNEVLVGAIRDDIEERKVYAIEFCDEFPDTLQYEIEMSECSCYEEFLLYDFSLLINDEVSLCKLHNSECIISAIENENIFDEYRDILEISSYGEFQGHIIEGIGSAVRGLFGTIYQNEYVRPYFLDFGIGEDESCLAGVWPLSDNEQAYNSNINLYPNPTTGLINFNLPSTEQISQVKLYDLVGNLVLNKPITNNQLDIEALKSGMLLIEIQTNQAVYFDTIIKQE